MTPSYNVQSNHDLVIRTIRKTRRFHPYARPTSITAEEMFFWLGLYEQKLLKLHELPPAVQYLINVIDHLYC
ncbi:hypothetical protein Moror_203 [Moniliophthora roreri MCA 2997]|uniref:Uncharacterized protein n=1 Tax=Moniliophthora roreri (strain MCA 2997) TaxID=1381753 RepID=V2XGW9_MONRO|nr:hypothetical protein Moror_203 [Moniliophthora roreri MCA 2997]